MCRQLRIYPDCQLAQKYFSFVLHMNHMSGKALAICSFHNLKSVSITPIRQIHIAAPFFLFFIIFLFCFCFLYCVVFILLGFFCYFSQPAFLIRFSSQSCKQMWLTQAVNMNRASGALGRKSCLTCKITSPSLQFLTFLWDFGFCLKIRVECCFFNVFPYC